MKNYYESKEKNNYIQARKNIGICNLSDSYKYLVYGPSAKTLINSYSIRNLDLINDNSFMTIMMNKNKYLCECQIIKLSPLKYLLITTEESQILKFLKKMIKKNRLCTVEDYSLQYSFFSFHGDKCIDYFKNKSSSNLYKVNKQGYTYYTMLSSSVNKFVILDHFKALGFEEINKYTESVFFNSHNVITNLKDINKIYQKSIFAQLYKADNCKFKVNKLYCIKQFESTRNFVVTKKMPIYNSNRKKVGYIHNFYRLNNKKYPYLLGIIKKYSTDKISILKVNKNEILIKEYQLY